MAVPFGALCTVVEFCIRKNKVIGEGNVNITCIFSNRAISTAIQMGDLESFNFIYFSPTMSFQKISMHWTKALRCSFIIRV